MQGKDRKLNGGIEMLHYRIILHGNVQGVGFRYFAWKIASLHSIHGWVRNRIDGEVEIDAQGSEENMKEFIKALKKGNGHSSVESNRIEKLPDMENYKSFDIIVY